jgi:hypothetical protein
MTDFVARRVRAIELEARRAFEDHDNRGWALVRLAYALRDASPNDDGSVA